MKTMPVIRVDRSEALGEEPGTGHNRWHRDISPIVWCDPGDEVILEMPTHLTLEEAKGFALSMGKVVLGGGIGEAVNMARQNLRNIPRP